MLLWFSFSPDLPGWGVPLNGRFMGQVKHTKKAITGICTVLFYNPFGKVHSFLLNIKMSLGNLVHITVPGPRYIKPLKYFPGTEEGGEVPDVLGEGAIR